MKVLKTTLPTKSVLANNQNRFDYVDSFEGIYFDKNNNITSKIIGKAFFVSAPSWVDKLFALRNKIVGLWGLKTSGQTENRQELLNKFQCEPNERLGLFKVFDRTENEVILGEDDKHLNFRVSLFIDQKNENRTNKKLIISTIVTFNNWFGRLYFLPVWPFHKLIVPIMLKEIIKNIENEN